GRVLVRAELLPFEQLGDRADERGAVLHVPDERLGGIFLGLLVRGRAVHHRERRGLLVAELSDRLLAFGEAASVQREPLAELLGRYADGEGAEADAVTTDLPVAVGAARGAPDRWVRT